MRNKLISIEKSQKISDIESKYALLYDYLNPDLLMPTNLKGVGIGALGALIQLIATWSRVSISGKLLTYINEKSNIEVELERFCNEFHGLVATQLTGSDRIFDRMKTRNLGEKAKQMSNDLLKEYQEYSDKFKGNFKQRDKTVVLGCFDNTLLEYPPYFYYTNSQRVTKTRDSAEFISLLQSILKILSTVELSQTKNSYNDPDGTLVNNIGIVVKELVDNTESWGKRHFDSKLAYPQNFRGLIAQIHTDVTYDSPKDPSEEFIRDVLRLNDERNEKARTKNKVGFCEISVIDNGAGFARMMKKKDFNEMTILEEYFAVMDCFKLNISSEGNINRGYGLTTMLQKIGKAGLLRLRTGRLCIYRNFFDENLDTVKEITQKDIKFRDWTSRKTDSPTELRVTEGALITIIYPFDY